MTSELSRLLLEAVSADCTAFESVVGHVIPNERLNAADCDPVSVDRKLLTLVGEGLVEAFLLHAEPPYITAVVPSMRTLPGFWFYITAKGEQYLGGLSKAVPPAQIPRSRDASHYC